jgi:tetratricopeptide (TPR) repeat protein
MEVGRWNRKVVLAVLMAACFVDRARAQGNENGARPAETELREGIALTSRGQFQEAIPHFLAARSEVPNSFALEFNLALCYVGARQFPAAIGILSHISDIRHDGEVKNLLAQALVGDRQPDAAWKAFQEASEAAPSNESLYVLVSQSCLDEGLTDLGGRVLETGLRNLPRSARLHFQRGIFYSQQDDNEPAARDFQAAQTLAPGSEIAYIADAEEALIAGRMQDVIRSARAGIQAGYSHYLLLTMLGEALLRAGATPDTPAEFNDARAALEKAVILRPGYSSSHIALGRIYLTLGRTADAVAQLEAGRRLDPRNKAVYPPLASAYQRSAQPEKAREALGALAELNREDAARIRAADGGRAGYVAGKPGHENKPPQ